MILGRTVDDMCCKAPVINYQQFLGLLWSIATTYRPCRGTSIVEHVLFIRDITIKTWSYICEYVCMHACIICINISHESVSVAPANSKIVFGLLRVPKGSVFIISCSTVSSVQWMKKCAQARIPSEQCFQILKLWPILSMVCGAYCFVCLQTAGVFLFFHTAEKATVVLLCTLSAESAPALVALHLWKQRGKESRCDVVARDKILRKRGRWYNFAMVLPCLLLIW